ncbi:hypothetical protein T265_10228 [Opisthorchis viverrini]|uniref:Uncharacterized protein n=1 Tax=Opisthorchis viverrini TaxID=6198 RepID=A0A074ZE09_OPIVI|nr:hypothetical protein T265_10228 [Opisthorchis viverrini]KER21435.1 hypothetical protein T265_10228 [Opisthorchis viverrini]
MNASEHASTENVLPFVVCAVCISRVLVVWAGGLMAHVSCSRYTEVIDLSGTNTIRNASFTIQPHERLVVDVNLETQLRSPCSISPTFSIADILAPPFDVHRATRVDECLSPKSPDEAKPLLASGTATPAGESSDSPGLGSISFSGDKKMPSAC